MTEKDNIRKIQFTGKSSYIVSLPKEWIDTTAAVPINENYPEESE